MAFNTDLPCCLAICMYESVKRLFPVSLLIHPNRLPMQNAWNPAQVKCSDPSPSAIVSLLANSMISFAFSALYWYGKDLSFFSDLTRSFRCLSSASLASSPKILFVLIIFKRKACYLIIVFFSNIAVLYSFF